MDKWKLRPNGFCKRPGPVVVVILDGIGIGAGDDGDAVRHARTPTLDRLWAKYPTCRVKTHGAAVGLPSDADAGNSEVGHNAIGAGRAFDQGAKLVGAAISDGSLFRGEPWQEMMRRCGGADRTMHFLGLLSDGNVHSHIDQLLALLRRCDADGIKRVRVHVLTDGRDVPPQSSLTYVDRLERALAETNNKSERDYRIASGGGRMRVTMDRYEADWAIVERGWRAHVLGEAAHYPSAQAAIEAFRAEQPGISDQDLPPFVVTDASGPIGQIHDGDCVVLFNFRGDRAIEISRAFEEADFGAFERRRHPEVYFAGMMRYDGDTGVPRNYLVQPPAFDRTLGEYLARNAIAQFACSETQKFGHVTYFWNGNRSGKFDERLEDYIEIASDRVSFDQRPWMKAAEITDATMAALDGRRYGLARVNYANGDMVGHTGDLRAAMLAVEAVDLCLGRLLEHVAAHKGVALVTADHGNADEMYQLAKDGSPLRDDHGNPVPKTSHSRNLVPLTVYDPSYRGEYLLDVSADRQNTITQVAATALWLMGFEAPSHYDAALVRVA